MSDGQSPTTKAARMRMLAMSAMALKQMALEQMLIPPKPSEPSQYRGPGKSITKAERAKRNVRKNIAKQSKKRNRRR